MHAHFLSLSHTHTADTAENWLSQEWQTCPGADMAAATTLQQ